MSAHLLRACLLWSAGLLAALVLSSTADAQPAGLPQEPASPAQLRELAATIAAERQALAEMRADLERRSTVLADLASRLDSLAPAAERLPQTVTPPEQAIKTSPEAPGTPALAVPRFDFFGDAKVRYETLTQDYLGCVGCPNRKRGRLRLRLGVQGRLSPDFTAAMGFSVGELNDPNSVYVNFGNKLSRKVATWDRGYVEYHPVKAPWLNLTAGKFPYTWIRSSIVFDVDFYPEGLSERLSFALKHAGPLKQVGVQGFQILVAEQAGDLHTKMMASKLPAGFVSATAS
jgi:Putative porin